MSAIDMATLGVFAWALALNILAGIISFFEDLGENPRRMNQNYAPVSMKGWRGIRGGGTGIFWRFYTATRIREEDSHLERTYISQWTKLPLDEREMLAIRGLLRRVSLLSLVIIGMVRFSMGESILNIF